MAARLKLAGRAHGVDAAGRKAFEALATLVVDAPHLASEAADVFADVLA